MQNRLKLLRKALKLKQREFAEKLGVDVSVVGHWETGSPTIPDVRIFQICTTFGVREEWLKFGTGTMFKPEETREEKLKNAALTLFNELSPEAQNAVLNVMMDFVRFGKNIENVLNKDLFDYYQR